MERERERYRDREREREIARARAGGSVRLCIFTDGWSSDVEASYIVRVILQIRSAASACPEPKTGP